MERQVVGLVMALLLCSCGDETQPDGAAGNAGAAGSNGGAHAGASTAGTSGSAPMGGAAGSSAGGSSGGSGPAVGSGGGGAGTKPRGAASLNILAPAGCSLTAGYEELPLTASGHAVTATEKGPGIEHGGAQSDGSPAKLGCRRIGANAPYRINVAIETGVGDATRLINITTGTTVGTAAPAGIVATLPGDLQFMGSCMVTPIEVDDTAHAVWAEFSCDSFMPFEGTDTCALGPSYLFVENCE